jgi:polyisoprenoid-binding protein YceI
VGRNAGARRHRPREPRLTRAAWALLLFLPGHGLLAQSLQPAPFRSGEVTFAMRATKVNDFVGHAAVSRAEFHGESIAHATGFAEVRVADMHTGIGLRDTHMRHAMQSDSFPVIRFEVTAVEPGASVGDSTATVVEGRMTIHGVTHPLRANGYVVARGNQTDVVVSFPIDMREYGIDPPQRFFGAIKVAPVTNIGVNLTFAPQ